MARFLDYVQPSSVESWEWERGRWRSLVEGIGGTCPGPDGLPYSFWRAALADWTAFLGDAAMRISNGDVSDRWVLHSLMVVRQKNEYLEDASKIGSSPS